MALKKKRGKKAAGKSRVVKAKTGRKGRRATSRTARRGRYAK
jgi:hypothetical protein